MNINMIIEKVKTTIGKLPFSKLCENSSVSILKTVAPFANYAVTVIGVIFVINIVTPSSSSNSVSGKKVTVQAKDAAYTIKSLQKSTNLIITDYIDEEILSNIGKALIEVDREYGAQSNDGKLIAPRLQISLDFSKTTGKPFDCDAYLTGFSILTSLVLPPHIKSISGKFNVTGHSNVGKYGCTSILISNKNEYFKSVDGVLYTKDGSELVRYPPAKKGNSFSVPKGVEFIGTQAFQDCGNLSEIKFAKTVVGFGSAAFSDITNLKKLEIPSGCTNIPGWAFSGCTSLEKLTIPSSVVRIEECAVYRCSSLKTIVFDGAPEQWEYLVRGEGKNDIQVTSYTKKAADVFPAAKITSSRYISDDNEVIRLSAGYWHPVGKSDWIRLSFNEQNFTDYDPLSFGDAPESIMGTYTVDGSTLTFNCQNSLKPKGKYEKTVTSTVLLMKVYSNEKYDCMLLFTSPRNEEAKPFLHYIR